MSEDSTTQCLLFPGIFRKPVVAQFDQREGSSDGGALLLKAADRRYGLVDGLAACLRDERQAGKVDHSLCELVGQRVFSIACGYPDANDSARLSGDPIHKLLLDRDPIEGRDLASQPTLSRFENGVGIKELYRACEFLAESVIRRHAQRLRRGVYRVTIDLDPTDDPTHGAQQLSFFNGHYDTWCYLPVMGFVSFNDEAEQYLYAQSISLNKLNFFGLGNDAALSGKSLFGMSQTIVGASAIKPVYELAAIRWLNLALLGEINGRFIDIRGELGHSVPSIETLYSDATAPGLNSQPRFVQTGEGLRIKPAMGNLQLNYMGEFEQVSAPSSSHNSFLRWTVDLDHTYSLYGTSQSATSAETVGPDSCVPGGEKCPEIPHTRNLNGSIGVRLLLSESITSGTSAVPFYFQQTLGGSDVNGAMSLGSYQDYRFRAPNLLLLQESFEHSIWGPFGLKFMADEGRVALTRGDLGFDHLKHSFAAGFTLRAGGFPMVSLMFAWGGPEGHHNIFSMNSSLLGGSPRPSL